MIGMVYDTYVKGGSLRECTFRYDSDNEEDMRILRNIMKLLETQKLCSNCINYREDGYMCGYNSHSCKIHGNIEAFNHPHHDGDGSKCDDYRRVSNDPDENLRRMR